MNKIDWRYSGLHEVAAQVVKRNDRGYTAEAIAVQMQVMADQATERSPEGTYVAIGGWVVTVYRKEPGCEYTHGARCSVEHWL